MTTQVATIGQLETTRRPTLEELVDRLMEALFAIEDETTQTQTVARSVHDARRMRQTGDLDGALATFADVNTAEATERGEPLGLRRVARPGQTQVRRRQAPAVQSGHRKGCGAHTAGRRHPGGGVRAGDAVASGQGNLQTQPAGAQAPGRCVMVVESGHVDLETLKSRHPLGDVVEGAGVRLRGRGRVRQGVCPFHKEAEGSFTVYGDTSRFHCFGCGATGDVLDFIQAHGGPHPARGHCTLGRQRWAGSRCCRRSSQSAGHASADDRRGGSPQGPGAADGGDSALPPGDAPQP